jgi:hypothetical protein
MSPSTIRHWQAASLVIAPAAMFVGFALHPHIGNPIDDDFLARLATAVLAGPTHWAVAHLIVAVASPLLALAFLSLRAVLREHGEERWSALGVPFIVMGSALYALLPAMELAPLASARAGGDHETVQAVQAALLTWFVPTLMTSAVLFAVGAVGFAFGIAQAGLLGPARTRLVVGALLLTAAARFVPVSYVQFHVQAVALVLAFWPVAYAVWTRPAAAVVTRPVAAGLEGA